MWCKSCTDELILLICHSSASITESSIFWNTEKKYIEYIPTKAAVQVSPFCAIRKTSSPSTISVVRQRLPFSDSVKKWSSITSWRSPDHRHDFTTLLRIRAIMARHQSWRCKVALLGISSIRILQNKYHQISLWHHKLLPFDHRIQAVKNEAASCNHKRSFKNIVHSSVCGVAIFYQKTSTFFQLPSRFLLPFSLSHQSLASLNHSILPSNPTQDHWGCLRVKNRKDPMSRMGGNKSETPYSTLGL